MLRLIPFALLAAACTETLTPAPVPVAASAEALSSRAVLVRFTAAIEQASDLRIFTPFSSPEETLAIESTEISGEVLTIRTAEQRGGRTYAIALGGVTFAGIADADAPTQINFEGFGTAAVSIALDTRGRIVPARPVAMVTLDPSTALPTADFRAVPLSDDDMNGVWTATVSAQIRGAMPYAARAVLEGGMQEAAGSVSFTVTSTAPVHVELVPKLARLPEFAAPIDPTPGDGKAPVRIVLDDRAARALIQPSMRIAVDANGQFDLSLSRVERARPVPGKPRVYEIVLDVAVDPMRRLDGNTPDTFPYVSFLVNDGQDVNERAANFVMPTEMSQVVVVSIGNPALVPVTFRVDIGSAILEPDARLRGKYAGEGIFLTGEFPNSEDALGRLAADAFSGGERTTLEMSERPDAPGIYEKVVFMPPGRPYGWKVVRCPTRVGCAELNRKVLSSGRAFPTVMKNLTTANQDGVQVVDPAMLSMVRLENGSTADYSRARVSETGMELMMPTILFKQEAPDLVVQVGTEPIITPIVVVGTWRDVNIPLTPAELLMMMGTTLELAPYDYDDGRMGRAAPVRDRLLPIDPDTMGPAPTPGIPAFSPTDGDLDIRAIALPAGAGRLPVHVAWNERELYVATEKSRPGVDHFVIVSLDPPSTVLPTHWAKAGTSAASPRTIFLAMEGDGDFSGWFRRGTTGIDDTQIMNVPNARTNVLEGAIDLASNGLGAPGASIWIAAVEFATPDGGALDAARQSVAGNGDGNIDAVEFREVTLSDVRAAP